MARYNMKVVKDYLKNARVSVIALGVIWVVYIFECIYTWVTFSTIFGLGTVPAITLLKLGGNVALLVKFGQVYRLFTAILLHAGILHIFMNSASLIAFCAGVEATVSFPLYITVFIVGGLQGNMLSDLYNLHIGTSTTVGVGSSTSICAVMGLFMAKLYIDSKKSGRGVELAKKRIIVMLVYIVIISLLPSVDFFGHIGSLISGGLIGLTVLPCGEAEVKQLSWLGIAGIVIYSLMLFSIFV